MIASTSHATRTSIENGTRYIAAQNTAIAALDNGPTNAIHASRSGRTSRSMRDTPPSIISVIDRTGVPLRRATMEWANSWSRIDTKSPTARIAPHTKDGNSMVPSDKPITSATYWNWRDATYATYGRNNKSETCNFTGIPRTRKIVQPPSNMMLPPVARLPNRFCQQSVPAIRVPRTPQP
jgi:hypothetical protein